MKMTMLRKAILVGFAFASVTTIAFAQNSGPAPQPPKSAADEIKEIQRKLTDIRFKAMATEEIKAARAKDAVLFQAMLDAQQELEKVVQSDPEGKAAKEKVRAAEQALNLARKQLNVANQIVKETDGYKAVAAKVDTARKAQAESGKMLQRLIDKKMIELDPSAKQLLERLSILTAKPEEEKGR